MESGKVLLFMCLILACVLRLSIGRCPYNEELVECKNYCNTCELQGFCYDCSTVACDCIPGYARDSFGVCIPKRLCSRRDDGDVLVAERGRCEEGPCNTSCQRRGGRGGRCKVMRCLCY